MYRLGKTAARPDVPAYRLARFAAVASPQIPKDNFGHEGLIGPKGWYMFANDLYGNCVWAGQAHAMMQWSREAKGKLLFNTPGVLGDYIAYLKSKGVIFDPKNPDTDQGSDMQEAANYWRKTGILAADGARHYITAHLGLDIKDILNQVDIGIYMFGGVGLGLQLPYSALNQTDSGARWTRVDDSPIAGGHYVWLNAKRNGIYKLVSWGMELEADPDFIQHYTDEARVYISPEMLIDRKSPENFDYDQLIAYVRQNGGIV